MWRSYRLHHGGREKGGVIVDVLAEENVTQTLIDRLWKYNLFLGVYH